MVSAITKTLLHAYNDLHKECKAIDEFMTNYAVGSAKRDIFKTVEKMVAYTNDKIALINAKVIVDETLDKMQRKSTMVEIYINKTRPSNRIPLETAEKQIEQFNSLLFEEYTPANLFDMISDSKFLMKIYKEYVRQERKALKEHRGKNESN